IAENCSAAAGQGVEAGRDQTMEALADGKLREPRQVDHFRRRERVQLERRIPLFDGAKQILVPREREVGVVAALEKQLPAADRNRLVDFPEQLVEPEDVAVGGSDGPIERTEVALRDADVP